jgi:SAM-dependent methyltransferase
MSWSDGYTTDVQYTAQLYRELAPGHLAFACLAQGFRPPDIGPGSAYLELGCGQGFGLNLLAAANPAMRFMGVDFLPGHIANARRLASAAELANVSFEDLSFEQMLALPDGPLPAFDFIVLHGVYSWISEANRRNIVQIIDRHLKPGGLVYVSYNCLPGSALIGPVQRFLREFAVRHPGPSPEQASRGLAAAGDLSSKGAYFFTRNPSVEKRLERHKQQSPRYLVHEYLNAHWHSFYHADVVGEMAGARLDYVGSATLPENLVEMCVPDTLAKDVRETTDPVWRETLLDYAGDKPFRRDLFVRGANRLPPLEHDALLGQQSLALTIPLGQTTLRFRTPLGELGGVESQYKPILEASARGPLTLSEIAALPAIKKAPPGSLRQAVALLAGSHQLAPVNPFSRDDVAPAQRLNRAICQRAHEGDASAFLAAPLIGSGVPVPQLDQLAIAAVCDGAAPKATGQRVAAAMEKLGQRFMEDGKPVEDPAGNRKRLEAELSGFFQARLKTYQSLAVL